MARKPSKRRVLTYTKVKKSGGKVYFYWRKQYQGKKRDFPVDPNASDKGYEAALRAWLELKDRLDTKAKTPAIPPSELFRQAVEELELLRLCHKQNEEFSLVSVCEIRINSLRQLLKESQEENQPLLLENGPGEEIVYKENDKEIHTFNPGRFGLSEYAIKDYEREKYGEQIAKLKNANPKSQYVSYQIAAFIASKEAESNVDSLSLGRVNNLRQALSLFNDWFGDKLVTEITGEVLLQYKSDLLNQKVTKKVSRHYLRDCLDAVKQFVKWMYLSDIIKDAPKLVLVKSDLLRIKTNDSDKVNNTFSNAEIHSIFQESNERNKLYWLLMLNTSMTQKDISDLKKSEFFQKEKKIIRKRSKTRNEKNVPFVGITLWDETYNLLLKYVDKNKKQELLLLNGRGKPIKHDSQDENGKYSKTDSIASAWYRLKIATKIEKEVTSFRNTGATRIKNKYGPELSRLFLGHAPMGVAERSYHSTVYVPDTKEEKELNEAIKWLYTNYEINKLPI